MVKKFLVPVLLGVVLVFIALSGCDLFMETEEFLETYQVAAGTKLKVYTFNGYIDISKWDKDSVEVYALKKTGRGRSELDNAQIEVTTNGDMVVKAEYTMPTSPDVRVNFEIKLPADVIVDTISTSNGKIMLEGITGDAVANSSNGNIDISNVDGYASATASNGDVDITGATGVVKARSFNGNIKVEIADLKNGGANITTSNGRIKAYLSTSLNANIEMSTSNGKVSIDSDIRSYLNITEESSKSVKATIGTGGSTIYIHTSNGKVNLYKLD